MDLSRRIGGCLALRNLANNVIKIVGLFKRRPGMTVAEFREHYETRHRLLGEKYLSGYASRYLRRFLDPMPTQVAGKAGQAEYDVIMEVWYADQATYEAARTRMATPQAAREILEDEERLFDRPTMRFFLVEEHESDLAG